jgi:hypothetical protein
MSNDHALSLSCTAAGFQHFIFTILSMVSFLSGDMPEIRPEVCRTRNMNALQLSAIRDFLLEICGASFSRLEKSNIFRALACGSQSSDARVIPGHRRPHVILLYRYIAVHQAQNQN